VSRSSPVALLTWRSRAGFPASYQPAPTWAHADSLVLLRSCYRPTLLTQPRANEQVAHSWILGEMPYMDYC
jgi:hypothetical protein